MSLKTLFDALENEILDESSIETIALSETQIEYLERVSPESSAFGWSHAIRTILDRFEQSGIDLTAASSEEEIAVLAAAELRANARLCVSVSNQSEARPEYRSNLPETGQYRFGTPPRSGRG
jgi:hypothetical protein